MEGIRVRNEAGVAFVDIEGTIGIPEECQFENPDERVATYEKFRRMVAEISDLETARIVVNIRSTGGDVNDALLIYEALRSTGAEITTRCYGYTASAATIIAQAASEGRREVSENALYLIHQASCGGEGTAEELSEKVDLLRKTDERLAEIYSQRSGRPAEEFALLMAENNGRGRWLSPEEVLQAGLCDTIFQTPKNIKKMSKDNMKGLFNKMVQAMAEILGVEQPGATNYVIVAQDGTTIEVDKPEGDAPEIGDTARPDGTFVLEDGTTLVIEGEKIVDKIERREPANDELEELKKENEALKAELEELKKKIDSPSNKAAIDFVKEMGGLDRLKKLASNHTPSKRDDLRKGEQNAAEFIAGLRAERNANRKK